MNVISIRTSAILHSALLIVEPIVVFPMLSVMTLVSVEADSKSERGTKGALPITI